MKKIKQLICNISTEQYYQYTLVQNINLNVLQFCVQAAVSYPSSPLILLSCIFCLYFLQVTQNFLIGLCYILIYNF